MIEEFDVALNFWEEHPDLKIVEPFKEFYTKDRTANKNKSSMAMWFIALCYSRASKFYKLNPEGEDGKYKVIGEDYCGSSNYYDDNKDKLDELIPAFINLTYSEQEQHVHALKELLHKRTIFLKTQNYDLENYDKLDKMVTGTKAVFDNLKKAEEELYKEDNQGIGKGGSVSSLND